MKVGIVVVALILSAGCLASPAADEAPLGGPVPSGQMRFEGQVMDPGLADRSGGHHEFQVEEPWQDVRLALTIHIDSVLVLTPPNCDGPDSDCALRFEDAGDSELLVQDMQPGSWQVDLYQQGYLLAGSEYVLTLTYRLAP